MTVLESIGGPRDLAPLNGPRLAELAADIRKFLVRAVSRTGGRLGPDPGWAELTVAPHRVFGLPRDRIPRDTGHQSYVHQLLTGRQDFARLRSKSGLPGHRSRADSRHHVVENWSAARCSRTSG